ncbi:MAG: Nramp family divalent metal transporter [Saprospiraceae bacterium]
MKTRSLRKNRFASILLWSVIAAAFIGPGTITTAGKAGATYGTALIWALVFSTLATIVLQEGVARIYLATGRPLGTILAERYSTSGRQWIPMFLFISLFTGCAAYEAGNILGAIAGLDLMASLPSWFWVVALSTTAGLLLWNGNIRLITRVLGGMVALMGIAFLLASIKVDLSWKSLMHGALIPELPAGSALLVVALIGTTIVPYNLFLGSRLGANQSLQEMRWGLGIAIILGGIISIAVLIVGSSIDESFSFAALANKLSGDELLWTKWLFGLGLAGAGLSSAITAPLATAIAGRTLFPDKPQWQENGTLFRASWMTVLSIGFLFGILDVKPVPAIILAQALNGILLPVVTIFLFFAVSDPRIIKGEFANSGLHNILFIIITLVTTFLGYYQILGALDQTGWVGKLESWRFGLASGLSFVSVGAILLLWLRKQLQR